MVFSAILFFMRNNLSLFVLNIYTILFYLLFLLRVSIEPIQYIHIKDFSCII